MPDFSIESIDFSSPWVLALIVLAAMLQDDLTCLIVGSAVVAGRISLVPAGAACWLGAWLGAWLRGSGAPGGGSGGASV